MDSVDNPPGGAADSQKSGRSQQVRKFREAARELGCDEDEALGRAAAEGGGEEARAGQAGVKRDYLFGAGFLVLAAAMFSLLASRYLGNTAEWADLALVFLVCASPLIWYGAAPLRKVAKQKPVPDAPSE